MHNGVFSCASSLAPTPRPSWPRARVAPSRAELNRGGRLAPPVTGACHKYFSAWSVSVFLSSRASYLLQRGSIVKNENSSGKDAGFFFLSGKNRGIFFIRTMEFYILLLGYESRIFLRHNFALIFEVYIHLLEKHGKSSQEISFILLGKIRRLSWNFIGTRGSFS